MLTAGPRHKAGRFGRTSSRRQPITAQAAPSNELLSLEGLHPLVSGKVRELFTFDKQLMRFAVDEEQVLIFATDRISAFDYILPTPIPDKGRVLTGLSVWWFKQLQDLVPNHLVSVDVAEFPEA